MPLLLIFGPFRWMIARPRRLTMTDDNIAQLLEVAGRSYTPDSSTGLARVKTRGAHQRRVRRTTSTGLVFLAVVSAIVGLVLTDPGGHLGNPVGYLRISPMAR